MSHLLFVDDCFSKSSESGSRQIREILQMHIQGSGQLVNIAKSAALFSSDCNVESNQEVHGACGVLTEALRLREKYLGPVWKYCYKH